MVFEHDSTMENFNDEEASAYEENQYPKNSFDQGNNVADDVAYLKKLLVEKKDLPSDFHQLNIQEQHDFLYRKICENCKNVPNCLAEMLPALIRPGDNEKSMTEKPEWLDMDKFRRGQKFVLDHFISFSYSDICGLYFLLSSNAGRETLIMTEKSHTPYLAFKRYTSSLLHFRTWYQGNVWDKNSEAFKSIRAVRRRHKLVNRKVVEMKKNGETASSKIPNICCPMWNSIATDMKSNRSTNFSQLIAFSDNIQEFMPFNQGNMSMTQGFFAILVILFPHEFGVHDATEEDIEALCHMWRGLGYLLGIEDEYNFYRGSVEEIKKRAHEILSECIQICYHGTTPSWEHMARCIAHGIEYFVPGIDFETTFLHLMELFGAETPKVWASLSYRSWIKYYYWKFLLRYATKVPGVMRGANYLVHYWLDAARNYGPEKHAELQARSAATISKLSSA